MDFAPTAVVTPSRICTAEAGQTQRRDPFPMPVVGMPTGRHGARLLPSSEEGGVTLARGRRNTTLVEV